jgi:uncharacterized protein (DUF1800 family)
MLFAAWTHMSVTESYGCFRAEVVVTNKGVSAAWIGLCGLALSGVLAGCGGAGGSTTTTPQSGPVTVAVTGASSVRLGSTVQMTATVANTTNTAVTWKVNGVAGGAAATGTISATGLFTPPTTLPNPDTVTVSAVSVASPTVSGSLSEAVWNPVAVVTTATATETAPGTTYSLDVIGIGFVPGATIQVSGSSVTTTYISTAELKATITVAGGVTTVPVTVVNPDPGGNRSVVAQAAVQPVVISLASAARLLDQATFGPTLNDIQHVQAVGINGYLTEQFNTAPTLLPALSLTPTAICTSTNLTPCEQSEWWQTAITGKDQLRQRVAFAMAEMFVVSTNSVNAQSVVTYQNMLATDAFSNFATVMNDVTLSTAMGGYLNMLQSYKPGNGQIANENFARENMQLFSIGLDLLNQDGTLQLDSSGNPIPAYTEAQVQAFARAYTGWTYATATGGVPAKYPNNTANYAVPMVALDSAHDTTAKVLLNGTTLPAGGTSQQDLMGALTNLFNHPNVGPFVCRQLIQHLVESNPSGAYVSRVAAVFANNGKGVRGDMQAVIQAILTDTEARAGDANENSEGGHLREGILTVANAVRGLGFVNSSSVGDYSGLGNYSATLNEKPYASGSVFNFFPPDYVIPDSTINAPEFGQENTATAMLRLTLADNIVYNRLSGFTVNLSATSGLGLTAANPANLVDSLGIVFMHGQMPAAMRTAIVNHITALTDNGQRVRVAAYLILTSPQYKILH